MMGMGALRAAAERGINAPRGCLIIGFDDIELGRYTYPALSTVGQSVRELGELAAQTLIDRIAGKVPATTRRSVVTPHMILRESTAAVPEVLPQAYRKDAAVGDAAVGSAAPHYVAQDHGNTQNA